MNKPKNIFIQSSWGFDSDTESITELCEALYSMMIFLEVLSRYADRFDYKKYDGYKSTIRDYAEKDIQKLLYMKKYYTRNGFERDAYISRFRNFRAFVWNVLDFFKETAEINYNPWTNEPPDIQMTIGAGGYVKIEEKL